jgi:hypothetical protein
MVTLETKRVMAIIISFGGVEGLERWAERMSELQKRYASGGDLKHQLI